MNDIPIPDSPPWRHGEPCPTPCAGCGLPLGDAMVSVMWERWNPTLRRRETFGPAHPQCIPKETT